MTARLRIVVASAAGVVTAAALTALSVVGVLRGPVAVVLLGVALLALPTARALSRRLALNLLLLIGVVPLLWWVPWPFAGSARAAIVCGILLGAVVASVAAGGRARAALVPRLRVADALLAVTAAVCGWVFQPFLTSAGGTAGVAMLVRATGGDNMPHFDVFEMIRRTGVAVDWTSPGQTPFEDQYYPQHFHALAAFFAQLWGGGAVGGIDHEVALYGIGTAFAVSAGYLAVVASVLGLRPVRNRMLIAVPAVVAVLVILVVGFGMELLRFGFPNFLLGVSALAAALLLVMGGGRTRIVPFAAVAAAVVTVAHTWVLLVPLVGVAFVVAALRLPWRRGGRRATWLVPVATITAGTGAAGVWAFVLVVRSTVNTGGLNGALELPGDIPANPVALTAACDVALIVLGILLRRRRDRVRGGSIWMVPVLFGATAAVLSVALAATQLATQPTLGYYPTKLLHAVLLVSSVLLVAVIALLVPSAAAASASVRVRPALVRAVSLLLVLVPGPVGLVLPVLGGDPLPVLTSHAALRMASTTDLDQVDGLLRAARMMAQRPCGRPIYLADDGVRDGRAVENTHAMQLSSTWTTDTAGITRALSGSPQPGIPALTRELLDAGSDRCVLVSSRVYAKLPSTLLAGYPGRVLSAG